MKTLRFLEKRITWILVTVTLPAAPLVAVTWPRLPSAEDFRQINEKVLKDWAPPPGPDVAPRLLTLQTEIDAHLNPWSRTDTMSMADTIARTDPSMRIWATPELRPVAQCLEPKIEPRLRRIAEVSHSGAFDFARESLRDSGWLGTALFMSDAGHLIASAQAGRGDYARAAETARDAVDLFDSVASDPGAAGLSVRAEFGSARLFEDLVGRSGDTSAAQAVLSVLVTPDSHPPVSPLPLVPLNTFPEFADRRTLFLSGFMRSRSRLIQGARNLAQDRPHMTRPENQAWASRIFAGPPLDRIQIRMHSFSLPWTYFSALKRDVQRVIRTEENLLWQRVGGREVFGETDPLAAALYAYAIVESEYSLSEISDKWRELATRKDLLRLGAAARLYRAEHGRWPERMAELTSQVSLTSDPAGTAAPDSRKVLTEPWRFPYTPYQMGQVGMTRMNVERLLGLISAATRPLSGPNKPPPPQVLELKQIESAIPGRSRYRLRMHSPRWSHNPLLAFALADAVRSRVADAQTTVVRPVRTHRDLAQQQDANDIPSAAPTGESDMASAVLNEKVITRDQALATALNTNPGIARLCPEARIPAPPASALESHVISVHLLIEAEVPDQVFAVWSRGADAGNPEDDLIVFLLERE